MAVSVDQSRRLASSEYFPEPQRKTGIAIHHTVCNSALKTLEAWRTDQAKDGGVSHVATAYVIDYDGTIYQAFEPEAWAYQFGLAWPDEQRLAFEKRFIGIEITSGGGLIEKNGKDAFACDTPYRGFRYFERYRDTELEALARLVDDLCTRFSIPRVYPEEPFLFYGNALSSFEGVIGHAMVRSDKSDPAPDPRVWETLEQLAGLRPVALPPEVVARLPAALGQEERTRLLVWNLSQIDRMDMAAGSLVTELILELGERDVQVRLAKPDRGATAIGYTFLGGDREQVARLAGALGFTTVTDSLLEVRHAVATGARDA